MKRILCFGMTSNWGGIESFLFNVNQWIDHNKVMIDYIKYTTNIPRERDLIDSGSKIFEVPSRRAQTIRYLSSLNHLFQQHPEYKIIHINLNNCIGTEVAAIAHRHGVKVISHSHNVWTGSEKIKIIADKLCKPIIPKVTDVFLSCSEAAGNYMFPNQRFTVIKNGVDLEKFCYDIKIRNYYRRQMNLEGQFVIGHVGRFDYQKNHSFILDIFKEIHSINPNTVLVLVGDGELRPMIEQKIIDLSLTNNVILTGIRSDVSNLMQAMDAFLLPSLFEGLPIVGIEAQAVGLPCFFSDTITKEVKVTNLAHFLQLSQFAEIWAKEILTKCSNYNRQNTSDIIRAAGYDIKRTANILTKIYLEN